ncbi:MAG TPA: sigma-70 family RNA polymerase sigma factor [Blastocatellia bacterium]|jgi:RNA polymerase sigma-70 factor (ECF subfamily)|nr:sigma-70 family RNA polymerase sigma factor [Blastocatellia bacterium]
MTEGMERRALMRETDVDGSVIEACRRGDRAAFQMLFEAYKDRVYSIALHYSGNTDMAGDVTQQVFLKLFTRMEQFRQDAEFTTWLYRIVANTCIDEQRSRKRFIPLSNEAEVRDMSARGSQEDKYIRREVAVSVREAISQLRPKLRMPILLKYVEGLSYEEIGQALGCSKGTVASRLNRGHKILAEKLSNLRGALEPEE